jgi:hypothetical protein
VFDPIECVLITVVYMKVLLPLHGGYPYYEFVANRKDGDGTKPRLA